MSKKKQLIDDIADSDKKEAAIDDIADSDKKEAAIDDSLRGQALKRAKSYHELNAGTPHDWEDLEKMIEIEEREAQKPKK
ncbi:MAG: hypothetical protein SVC26_05395 [Pseudomonadota bacterium]|nr:hypothetical protein [Pseudomonadota bacterium]